MENNGYTDKQLRDATQVAYLDCIEPAMRNLIADGKKGPYTLRDLIMEHVNLDTARLNLKLEGETKRVNDLGIRELIEYSDINDFDRDIIKTLSDDAFDWKVVDIHDKNAENGFYGCVIETAENEAIVAFRGSEGRKLNYSGIVNDWIKADFGLLKNECTEQQKEVERYIDGLVTNGILDKYEFLAATGHSLGGNLASHFAIASSIGEYRKDVSNKLKQVVNFDGPGMSKEYLSHYSDAIKRSGEKIKHYKWSLIGSCLNDIPGEEIEYLAIDENQHNESLIDQVKYNAFLKHATTSLKFSKSGKAIRGDQDVLSKFIHSLSVGVEYVPVELIADMLIPNGIQTAIGIASFLLEKAMFQKEDGGIGIRGISKCDEENSNLNYSVGGITRAIGEQILSMEKVKKRWKKRCSRSCFKRS